MNFSDERLARRAARGDQRAFEAIYRRYEHDLYRFCLAMVGNVQDAQDALQNTMVKVLRALPGEQRQIRLKPWLYRIARNEAVEVLRRRRGGGEIETEPAANDGVVEVVETRERLRGLFADLEQLPERQRAALVMREMAGLGFEQIGASFETSAAVARQTVYEARLSLREMEAGRAMDCDAVTAALSDADGRIVRRRDIRAHLRNCESCRAFREGIESRRDGFAAVTPLPAVLAAGLLQGAIGAGKAGVAVGAAGGTALVKSAATVAVVAAIGATAADRGGLIELPVLGGGTDSGQSASAPPPSAAPAAGHLGASRGSRDGAALGGSGPSSATREGGAQKQGLGRDTVEHGVGPGEPTAAASQPQAAVRGEGMGHGRHQGKPEGLPPASQKGQETAAANKPPPAATPPGPGGSGGSGEGGGPPERPGPPASLPPQAKGSGPPTPPAGPPVTIDPPAGKGVASEKPPAKP